MGCCRCSTSGTIPTVSGPLVPSLQVGTAITPTVQEDLAMADTPCGCADGGAIQAWFCKIPWPLWVLIVVALVASRRRS
jgi:hypothetical protein